MRAAIVATGESMRRKGRRGTSAKALLQSVDPKLPILRRLWQPIHACTALGRYRRLAHACQAHHSEPEKQKSHGGFRFRLPSACILARVRCLANRHRRAAQNTRRYIIRLTRPHRTQHVPDGQLSPHSPSPPRLAQRTPSEDACKYTRTRRRPCSMHTAPATHTDGTEPGIVRLEVAC